MAEDLFKTHRHTPAHLFKAGAIYIITGATYQKKPLIQGDQRKRQWRDTFQYASDLYHWNIIAWVVLNNHYHVIVGAPEQNAASLPKFVSSYHKFTARKWNTEDGQAGRQVWWNYWDTCIRSEKDYLARFNYVHWNSVKHGAVDNPEEYPFSSYPNFYAMDKEMLFRIEQEYPYRDVLDVPDDY